MEFRRWQPIPSPHRGLDAAVKDPGFHCISSGLRLLRSEPAFRALRLNRQLGILNVVNNGI